MQHTALAIKRAILIGFLCGSMATPPHLGAGMLEVAEAQEAVTLWVLTVGISQYAEPRINLQFADNDARQIASTLATQQGRLFREVYTRVLVNRQATRGKHPARHERVSRAGLARGCNRDISCRTRPPGSRHWHLLLPPLRRQQRESDVRRPPHDDVRGGGSKAAHQRGQGGSMARHLSRRSDEHRSHKGRKRWRGSLGSVILRLRPVHALSEQGRRGIPQGREVFY